MKTITKLQTKKKIKLTDAQRRLRIVKDAIAQIKAKTFIATSGDYVNFSPQFKNVFLEWKEDEYGWQRYLPKQPEESMQKVLNDIPKNACEVCAQGAIFLSYIRKENKVTVGDAVEVGHSDEIKQYTKSLFSAAQLNLMEQYFELWSNLPCGAYEHYIFESDLYDWFRAQPIFKKTYQRRIPSDRLIEQKDELRLLAILENMLKNNGLFKP